MIWLPTKKKKFAQRVVTMAANVVAKVGFFI